MYSFLLDMSLPGFRFGIIDQSQRKILAFESSDKVRESAKEFPKIVQNILTETRIRPNQINEIFLGTGPGSFTGMRMSLAYSLGLLCASSSGSIKWHGFSALSLLGHSLKSQSDKGAAFVVLPSTRAAGFVWHSSKINDFLDQEKSVTLDELANEVSSFEAEVNEPIFMLGKWPEFEGRKPGSVLIKDINREFRLAMENSLLNKTLEMVVFSSSSDPPELRYFRKSSAEEKRDQV